MKLFNRKSGLEKDILKSHKWIMQTLNTSGYKVDYTVESFKEIDRFFEENVINGQPVSGGLLATDTGSRLFALGAFIGETIIRVCGGDWILIDRDKYGEINITVKLDNGTILFPVKRCIKRFKNGSQDGIYIYGYLISDVKRKRNSL
ncbi:hypothetical protein RJG79_11520 [Mycoplasmatota bacterium WC44]